MSVQLIPVSDFYAADSFSITIANRDYVAGLFAGGYTIGKLVQDDMVEVIETGIETERKAANAITRFDAKLA